MSVQKFHGTINTDGIKDERGIETPSLSATGEVAGQTGEPCPRPMQVNVCLFLLFPIFMISFV